jgi:hypothetical protein
VVALALPATAQAGGWATVGVSSSPDGIAPGEPWVAQLTILQHGVTPLEDVQPRVLIDGPRGQRRAFAARPAGEPGVYRASVTFPSAGTWRYAVDDGFTQTHTFAPVTIDGPPALAAAAASGGGSGWLAALGVVGGAGLLLALVLVAQRIGTTSPRGAR